MPRTYTPKYIVTKMHTVDGITYTNCRVVIHGARTPGFTFITKSDKNGKAQILWPRVFVGGEKKLERIIPFRGQSATIIKACKKYIEEHPWEGHEEMEQVSKNYVKGLMDYLHRTNPGWSFTQIAESITKDESPCSPEEVEQYLMRSGVKGHQYCAPGCIIRDGQTIAAEACREALDSLIL